MSRRGLLVAVVGVLVVLAGCSGAPGGAGGGPSFDGQEAEQRDQAPSATTTAAPTDAAAPSGDDAAETDQVEGRTQVALIRTGTVKLRVEDFQAARDRLTGIARNNGGYVSDSGQTLHRSDAGNRTTGYLVVRVPAEEFSATLSAVREEGVVLSERTKTTDVSDRLVDLEARLSNLEARRDRLRDFYGRANTTEELLRIEDRLSEVQGEIERLEAKKRALEDRVAYSTLRIELTEPGPGTPTPTPTPTPAYHQTSPTTAFFESIAAIITIGRTLVVTGAYALPYLLLGAPLAAALVALRRRRGPRGGEGGPPPTREPPTGEGDRQDGPE